MVGKRFEITDRQFKTDIRLCVIVTFVVTALLAVMWWVGMSKEEQTTVILPLIGAITAAINSKIREFTGTADDNGDSHHDPGKSPKPEPAKPAKKPDAGLEGVST